MWWLIIPIAVFIIILCIVLNEAHERQVKQSARMPIDDSWLFDNVDEPYREFEFETSDETEIFKDMTDRIKLEDMTLAQIKEQKGILADKVRSAIAKAVAEYHESYDCGDVGIRVATEVNPSLETELGDIIVPAQYWYDIKIKFSKEDE